VHTRDEHDLTTRSGGSRSREKIRRQPPPPLSEVGNLSAFGLETETTNLPHPPYFAEGQVPDLSNPSPQERIRFASISGTTFGKRGVDMSTTVHPVTTLLERRRFCPQRYSGSASNPAPSLIAVTSRWAHYDWSVDWQLRLAGTGLQADHLLSLGRPTDRQN